jgi:outer membrane protein OmpA-like peptidoglycan-associated protein
MKKIFLVLCIVLLGQSESIMAQSKGNYRAKAFYQLAERDFQDLRFWYAVPFYKAALQQKSAVYDSICLLHLAESYWQMKYYDSAQFYFNRYESVIGSDYMSSRRLAEIQAIRQQPEKALAIYQSIEKRYPGLHSQLVQNRIKGFSQPEQFSKNADDYTFSYLRDNSSEQDFSPSFFQKGIVFVSNRFGGPESEKEFGWDGLPYARIYEIPDLYQLRSADTMPARKERDQKINIIINDDYTPSTSNDNNIRLDYRNVQRAKPSAQHRPLGRFSDQFSSLYNYGPLCFTTAGDKVYFTRNSLKSSTNKHHLEICEATLGKNGWGSVRVLPFVDKDFDYFHPAINKKNDRLYFSSNQPGGRGGADIYSFSLHPDSSKANPLLLDERFNTEGDELFANFSGDTLFFSSDGLPGLGGLDIYAATDNNGAMTNPVNIGIPANSNFDDFGLIWNDEKHYGFFSSSRLGSDDIFRLDLLRYPIKITGSVFDLSTGKEMQGALVQLKQKSPSADPNQQMTTELYGAYRFPVKSRQRYTLIISRQGYYTDTLEVNGDTIVNDLQLPPVMLRPIPPPPPPPPPPADSDGDGIPDSADKCPDLKGDAANSGCPEIQKKLNELAKMVYFENDKDVLTPEAKKPLDEAAAILLSYPQTTLIIEGHTDNMAGKAYNLDLSLRRAKRVKSYLVSKGVAATRFTKVEGFGMAKPIADNSTPEGRALNRRVYIKAQFYE